MKFLIFLMLIITISSYAEIIHVPDDHETIQGAIDATEDGDTVLVEPGEYVENISTAGKTNITVGSLTIVTEDPAYIDSTIIDGGGEGVVVVLQGNGTVTLRGFTIRNGNTRNGSAISASGNFSVDLQDLYITQNQGELVYACVYINKIRDADLRRVRVTGNNDKGIWIRSSRASLTDCEISNNQGIGGQMGADQLELTRVALINNLMTGLSISAPGTVTLQHLLLQEPGLLKITAA